MSIDVVPKLEDKRNEAYEPNIGLDREHRERVSKELSRFLADTYSVYLKTQNFHWNVKGMFFFPLHNIFEKNYRQLAEAIDEIAERITSLGQVAEATFESYEKLTQIEGEEDLLPARRMLQELTQDHEKVIRTGRLISKTAGDAGDEVTLDMVVRHLSMHEKISWMLRSCLQDLHALPSKKQ